MRLRACTLFAVICAGLAAAAAATAERAPATSVPRLYGDETETLRIRTAGTVVLHDRGRGKSLPLRVTYPDATGPFPVVLFSHGATASKNDYGPLITHWAGHGYICVQPTHADSAEFEAAPLANSLEDLEDRTRDLTFVLDSLERIEARVPDLKGKMTRHVIGVGGHSFGAHTAQLLAGVSTVGEATRERQRCSDSRPRAFLLLSPQGPGGPLDDHSWDEVSRPVMVITGTRDVGRKGQSSRWRAEPFQLMPPGDKYLAFIAEGDHSFGGITGLQWADRPFPRNDDHVRYVRAASLAFWDAHLKGRQEAWQFLNSDQFAERTAGAATITARHRPE